MNTTNIASPPEDFSEESLVSLLTEEIPLMTIDQIDRFDFNGRNAWQNKRDFQNAIWNRIVAAKGYVQNSDYKSASFSYNRAAQLAAKFNLPMVGFRCSLRAAAHLQNELLYRGGDESIETDVIFTQERVVKTATDLISSDKPITTEYLFGNHHDWFPGYSPVVFAKAG